jgi:hypothetical protein
MSDKPPSPETTINAPTEAMIQAGVDELCARERAIFHTVSDRSDYELVEAIYLAMEVARVR